MSSPDIGPGSKGIKVDRSSKINGLNHSRTDVIVPWIPEWSNAHEAIITLDGSTFYIENPS